MNVSLEIILDIGKLLPKGYKERYTIDLFEFWYHLLVEKRHKMRKARNFGSPGLYNL